MAFPMGSTPPLPIGRAPIGAAPLSAPPSALPLKKKKKPDLMPASLQGLRAAALGPPKVMG